MKKHLFFAALAALAGFTSCNSEEELVSANDEVKSVRINLQDAFAGMSRGQSAAVENGTKAKINTLDVYFLDASGNAHTPWDENKASKVSTHFELNTTTSTDAEAGLEGTTFHFLPEAVTKVVVIANAATDQVYADFTNAEMVPGVMNKIEEAALAIANEQTTTNLRLFGQATLTAKEEGEKENADVAYHQPVYEANVLLEPRVSRLEISSFSYNADEDGNRHYDVITIKQIYFTDYYSVAAMSDGEVSGTKTVLSITEGTVFNVLSTETAGWYNNTTFNPEIGALNEDSNWKNDTGYTVPVAYNFFSGGSDITPRLIVWLQATYAEEGNDDVQNLYLETNGFSVANATEAQKGKAIVGQPVTTTDDDGNSSSSFDAMVYKVAFEFDDDDLSNPTKCVDLTVDVTPWQVVNVTPEF